MLPLRATEGVQKFPRLSLLILVVFGFLESWAWMSSEGHHPFILNFSIIPSEISWTSLDDWKNIFLSFFLFESLFALWITCVYWWAFSPRLFETHSPLRVLSLSFVASIVALFLYKIYHGPSALAPLLMSQIGVSAVLGVAMRHEIWGSVSTLVVGPKLFQVFEVPSYVLLFFWFFYLMVGYLFLASPFSDAPTLYFLPLLAFLFGFLLESAWLAIKTSKFLKKSA